MLDEKWTIVWWAWGVALLALATAQRCGFFKPFLASPFPIIRGMDVLKGFAFFIFMQLFLFPALAALVFFFLGESATPFFHLSQRGNGWLNLWVMAGGGAGAAISYMELKVEQQRQIWQQTGEPWYWHAGIGITSWFVIYPLALSLSQLVSIAMWHLFHYSAVEQIAVQHFRKIAADPLLFSATGLLVVTLVPLTEEFLFRALLQSWLKRKFSHAPAAVVTTSVVFALFHYSASQGLSNIELLSSLFFLSCMLGFIYERQRSLWAPVGLHSFFNFMSLLMIFLGPFE